MTFGDDEQLHNQPIERFSRVLPAKGDLAWPLEGQFKGHPFMVTEHDSDSRAFTGQTVGRDDRFVYCRENEVVKIVS